MLLFFVSALLSLHLNHVIHHSGLHSDVRPHQPAHDDLVVMVKVVLRVYHVTPLPLLPELGHDARAVGVGGAVDLLGGGDVGLEGALGAGGDEADERADVALVGLDQVLE